jgi:hypothetical protein
LLSGAMLPVRTVPENWLSYNVSTYTVPAPAVGMPSLSSLNSFKRGSFLVP